MHTYFVCWLYSQVFPHIAADNQLFAYTLSGYWMDVGQPKDYLKGACVCLWVFCVHKKELFAHILCGHWMGQPKDYLKGACVCLEVFIGLARTINKRCTYGIFG